MFKHLLFAFAVLTFAAPAQSHGVADRTLRSVVHDLCDKKIAVLGENDHGDGRTIAFKAELVQRLVRQCRYNAVFFEASHYDFLDFSRRVRLHQPISADMVSSSIGGIWNRDEELEPLVSFLFSQARDGRIRLGGLDDQLGSVGAFYSLHGMPAELAGRLKGYRSAECRELLTQRINYEGEHTAATQSSDQQCLAEIASAIRNTTGLDRTTRDEELQMVASMRRALARDFLDLTANIDGRDRSMYQNFRWLAARLPRGSKIIVWTATAHAAKHASALPEYAANRNLGAYLHAIYGKDEFVLGFSALGGSHFWSRQQPDQPIVAAAAGSIEHRALDAGSADSAYVGPAALSRFGSAQADALSFHKPLTTRWADVLDGLVVFRIERPPHRSDAPPAG